MENIVYEKDYSEIYEQKSNGEPDKLVGLIWKELLQSGVFDSINDRLKSVPKVVVREGKKHYEYLLVRLDELAKNIGGKIRGVVNYDGWEASITLDLPYLDFNDSDGRMLLREIAAYGNVITILAPDKDCIRLEVIINYFEDLMSGREREALIENEFSKQQKLVDLMDEYSRRKKENHSDDELEN